MGWILGDKFDTVASHKGSIKVLWETKWKYACEKSVYPFHDGRVEDFQPIFEKLIATNINDAYSDEYTEAFLPLAESLDKQASDALSRGDTETASDLFRRAAVVYRISRFPYVGPNDGDIKRLAFERQKNSYLKAASLWKPRIEEHIVQHTHRADNEGHHIPNYIRIPDETAAPGADPVPCILILTGLDGYRPDNSQRTHELTNRGWAVAIVEIPGTADSPADSGDPTSPDRLIDSVLDYMDSKTELNFDMSKVVIWGLSAGGYYAIRAAHTHASRLAGAIAHGPGAHYFLDRGWLSKVEDHEYPFPIVRAWAKKYGYDDPAEFVSEAQGRFSLLETGILDRGSCRLLLLNGVDDGIVPIEDCYLLFSHGSPKEGRFHPGLPHMGYPDSLGAAYRWLEGILGSGYSSLKN
ncbi:heptaketide hydrolyase ayg1 [Aspergillus undulatus]|uniref:heptaketide hydrolyase ayg1 n=1 Tax=Aspergillus undulatus TaxID=1810928 RepID=UPI003CCDB434